MPRFTPYFTLTSFISSKTHFRLEEICLNVNSDFRNGYASGCSFKMNHWL